MKKTILSIVTMLAISTSSLSATETYATVNGEDVTKQDLISIIRNKDVNFDTLPKETKDRILNQLIEKKLLTQKAIKSGVQNDTKYKESLAKIKEDLALEVYMQKEFLKVKTDDKEKKEFYSKNKDKFMSPATLEARHILLKTEKEAKDIISKLDKAKNKKGSFEELAKKFSIGPTKTKGGYLGKFQANQMVPEFSAAAMALNKDEYTKAPIKTQFGYHVIYLDGKEESAAQSFEEVEEKISQLIIQEKYGNLIKDEVAELRKNAKIIIK